MKCVNCFLKAIVFGAMGVMLTTATVHAQESTLSEVLAQNAANDASLQYSNETVESITRECEEECSKAAGTTEEVTTEIQAEEPAYLLSDMFKKLDIKVSGSATLDYYTSYIWRGQVLDRDSVIQPGVSMTFNALTVGYWGNWDINNTADSLNSAESDYYVALNHTFMNFITAGVGHLWYSFPGSHTSSKEIYATAAFLTMLNPVFTFAHDYEDGKDLNSEGTGNYYSLALSHSLPLKDKYGSSVELGVTGGYIDGQWLSGQGFHVTPSIGLKILLASNISITPTVGYNFPMEDLKDTAIGNQKNKFFSAVKTAYSF